MDGYTGGCKHVGKKRTPVVEFKCCKRSKTDKCITYCVNIGKASKYCKMCLRKQVDIGTFEKRKKSGAIAPQQSQEEPGAAPWLPLSSRAWLRSAPGGATRSLPTLLSLKVDPIFSFLEARAPRKGQGDPGESQGRGTQGSLGAPWLSPGSHWPSLGAPGLQNRKNGIYF